MKRNGFATVMAIVLIGILGVTLTVLAATAVREHRRAATDADDAQASQLLAAAARIAEKQAAEGKPVPGPVETPVGRVTLQWKDAASCEVEIVCGHASRFATFRFDGGRLTSVQ